MKINKYFLYLILFLLIISCNSEDVICETDEDTQVCEGTFYSSRFISANNGFDVDYFLDSFAQPIPSTFAVNEIEEIPINLPSFDPFSSNFSTYDSSNNTYAFHYLFDDSPIRILYLANPNGFNSQSFLVQQDYAAPVFLNGQLFAINGQNNASNLAYDILQIDQSTGVGTSIFSNTVVIDGFFANGIVSSATNGIDTIYFLGIKTLISFNINSGISQVLDIDIQYDADIQTALSGLEYRTSTNQLLAIHHNFNSPTDINEILSINPLNGSFESLFDLEDNIGSNFSSAEPVELLINSTTYSSCADTYYITEFATEQTDPIENSILTIDLQSFSLTKRVTSDFVYGITLDETP